MTEVISVRFRGGCKAYYFDPKGLAVSEGDEVIVETAQGAEFGIVSAENHTVGDEAVVQPLRPLLRKATDEDRNILQRNRKREEDAVGICEQKIADHNLEMKLVGVECSFEGNKMLFFFTADGRVDFRELVRDLASVFHARIELRQIGVRDEAKLLGGLGICGRPFCCKGFLDEFAPVSIKMAKTQNLSLNPTKISGTCGRLMCCLKYEQHAYEDALTRAPRSDSFVQTPDGPGNVSSVNLVRETVTVRLDEHPESPKTYSVNEILLLRSGKGSREGIDIPPRPTRIARPEEDDKAAPFVRTFRNSPPSPAAQSSEGARANSGENKPVGGRNRGRGGRGRTGVPNDRPRTDGAKSAPNRPAGSKTAPAGGNRPASPRPGAKQTVRFASSIPIAENNQPGGEKGDSARSRPHRRGGRRRSGGRGSEGGATKSE